MIDYTREDVIEALENLLSPVCTETQFDYCDEIRAAIAFLKEQEPRVMTLEEIKDNIGVPVWVEYANDENWNGYGVPTSDYKTHIMIYGANDFCSHYARTNNVKWRCWTSAPTEEQRKAAKWNDKT